MRIITKFDCQWLKQDKVTFNHKTVVIVYIFHEINFWLFKQSVDFTLGNYFFGAVKLTKASDFEKHKYSGQWYF